MQWLVFSRLDPATAKALEVALAGKLEAILDENPGRETAWNCAAIAKAPKGVEKPKDTKSIFKIDEPAEELEADAVAMAMMRFLLDRCEPIAVDWGEGAPRQTAEDARAMIDDLHIDDPLLEEEEEAALFERVLEAVLAASEDLERGMELKEAIQEASPQARAWMEHVIRNQVASDEAVDRVLRLDPDISKRVHQEIEDLLEDMAE